MTVMIFACEKNLLLEAVNTVSRAVLPKATSPVMEGILVECYEEGRIKLIAYDLSLGIETQVPGEVKKGGTFVVNAKMFGDILRAMDNDTVSFKMDEHLNLSVSCATARFVIGCIDAAGFPNLPMIREDKTIEVKEDMLSSMLRQTLFAVSENAATPILQGTQFRVEEGKLELVATNQYKLAIRREPYLYEGDPFRFVVPGKTVTELNRMLKETDDMVRISLAERQIVFELNNTVVISRLLEGDFLDYEKIMPHSFTTVATLKIDGLKRAMERASILLNNEKIRIPVRFSFEFDSIVTSCRSSAGNTLTDEIKASIDGNNLEIGFNNKYILEILAAAECDEIMMGMNKPNSVMKVTPTEGERFVFLLSPMHLRSNG